MRVWHHKLRYGALVNMVISTYASLAGTAPSTVETSHGPLKSRSRSDSVGIYRISTLGLFHRRALSIQTCSWEIQSWYISQLNLHCCLVVTGTLEFWITFQKQFGIRNGMSSSQLTHFFRGVQTTANKIGPTRNSGTPLTHWQEDARGFIGVPKLGRCLGLKKKLGREKWWYFSTIIRLILSKPHKLLVILDNSGKSPCFLKWITIVFR